MLVVAGVVVCTSMSWGQVDTAVRSTAASAEQIQQWIEQLESDRFVIREAAMANLIKAGEPVIDGVTRAVMSGRLETIARGLMVLRELATDEGDTGQAAQEAIERVAQTKVTAAAHRAALTLRSIDGLRQERAERRLHDLGATIADKPIEVGVASMAQKHIHFDDQWRGTIDDLKYVRWLVGFQRIHVTLTGKQVTDRWLEVLAECDNVTQLLVKRTKMTDDGMKRVSEMAGLQFLSLRYNFLTDASVDHLLKLRDNGAELSLGLQIYGTQLSRDGIQRLKESLEGIKVDYRRGAFLGISGDRFNNINCSVASVEPNQAADRAGILRGDVILSYDGNEVRDFEGLTSLIAENGPGDRVRLKIQRGQTEIEIEIELGEWP